MENDVAGLTFPYMEVQHPERLAAKWGCGVICSNLSILDLGTNLATQMKGHLIQDGRK